MAKDSLSYWLRSTCLHPLTLTPYPPKMMLVSLILIIPELIMSSLFVIAMLGLAFILILVLVGLIIWPRLQENGVDPSLALGLLAGWRSRKVVGLIVFLAIFMCVGVLVMRMGIRSWQNAKASEGWPAAYGNVVNSNVGTHDSDGTTMYEAEIVYRYTIEGITYTGDKVTFADVSQSNSRPAYETVDRYPVGTQVTVYYDPDNPASAVLEPGMTGGVWLPLGVGGAFVCVSGFMMVAGVFSQLRRGFG